MLKPNEYPGSYYAGQEFVEDKESVDGVIEATFDSPATVEAFTLKLGSASISVREQQGSLVLTIERCLSKRLLSTSSQPRDAQFIVGYLARYLPRVNYELLQQRYASGHFLIRTFSTLDVRRLRVRESVSKTWTQLPWPPVVPPFPNAAALAPTDNHVFMRDFIDAGNSYLRGDVDDSLRKIVTAVENTFHHYNLKAPQLTWWQRVLARLTGNRGSFRRIVDAHVRSDDLGRTIIADNLIYLYSVRNKIVHNHFRLRPENVWLCKRAIGTLQYFFQLVSRGDAPLGNYVRALAMHFLLLDQIASGINLDDVARLQASAHSSTPQIMHTPADVDRVAFEALRITPEEKRSITNGTIDPRFYS